MTLLTSKPKPFALSWEAGSTVPVTINYNRLDGTVPSLVGGEIWVTFKPKITQTDNETGVIQKTLSGGTVTITDAVNGVAIAYLTPAQSVIAVRNPALPAYIYQVDVKVKEASGNEWVAASGTLTLTQTATKTIA